MSANHAVIIDDEFRRGYRLQRSWSWSMATAFFFGELGAGLFLVSLYLGFIEGLIAGLLLTAVGKTTGHLLHLGQPTRAWRAIYRLRSSWISRGLLAIVLFTGFGLLHVMDLLGLTFGLLPPALSPVVVAIAGAAAIVIMVYQGFAMSHSAAIALWSGGLMPVMSFTYALLGGVVLTIALGYSSVLADRPADLRVLEALELVLALFGLVAIVSLLHATEYNSKGGQLSAALLIKGPYAKWFVGVVIVIGLVAPALAVALKLEGYMAALTVTAAVLAGYYTFRVLVFKAAVFDPVQSFLPRLRRD